MNEILMWVWALVPAIVSGAVLFYAQRAQKKRDEKEEKRLKARCQETKLILDLLLAAAKLSYATAEAIKRGSPNGEIEKGEEAYEKAMAEFQEFEREQISQL